jgi:hypothetical protein
VCGVFQLSGELDAAQISVKDLEQKVSLLEHSNMANRDPLLGGGQDRHEKEMIGLRNRIESITAKLNGKVCCRAKLISGFHINA